MKTFFSKNRHERLSCKLLVELFFVFFKIGMFTFGGGLAMLPMLTDELFIKRKWVSRDELLDYFAIGQCTPGIIAVNVATFVGYKKQGIAGGIVATLGMSAPSIIVITLLASFFSQYADVPAVKKAFAGINVAVAALLTKVVLTFTKNAVHSILQALILITVFCAVLFFRIHTGWIVCAVFAGGFLLHLWLLRKERRCVKKDGKGIEL